MQDKVALVTGSSRGIGKSIAFSLAREGFNIVVNSTKQEDAQKVSEELAKTTGVKSIGIAADVTKSQQVKKLIDGTIKEFNRIDVLVNNAGVAIDKPFSETTESEYDYTIDTNLKGVFLCCKEAIPHMMSQRSGYIINVNSGAGKTGISGLSVYCASKFGVIGLAESMAQELQEFGISVVSVCPGAVATDMQKQFMTETEYERRKNSMTQPEEVAKIVVNAVKEKYKTGSAVDVY